MMDYSKSALYHYPREIWNKAKCEKLVKRNLANGYGDKWPFKGYLYEAEIKLLERYNGGTIINSKWYQGYLKLLPELAPGYKIIFITSWGYRIVKEGEFDNYYNEKSVELTDIQFPSEDN